MKHRKNVLQKLAEHPALYSQPLPGIPLVEIAGDRRILVENHQGITEYYREKICIRVKYGHICVLGNELELSCMTGQKLVISGKIDSVAFMRGAE